MQNVFAGLATENAVCTSHSIAVEPLEPVPCIAISTDAAPGPATRNFNPCPVVPLTTASTSSAVQLSPAATAQESPVTSPKLAKPFVQSAAYPTIGASWRRAWEQVIPFFAYPAEVRKIIYTTNAIESLNMQLQLRAG